MRLGMGIGGVAVVAMAVACGGRRAPSAVEAIEGPSPVDAETPVVASAGAVTPAVSRSNRCTGRVSAIGFWQGEYPGPVVQVDTPLTVPAYVDPCDERPTTTCDVTPGLFHPWVQDTSVAFATVRGENHYRVVGDASVDGPDGTVKLAVGTQISVIAYHGEGFCGFRVAGVPHASGMCPEMASGLEAVDEPDLPEVQLMKPACGAWVVVDDALMARPEVREGQTLGFGDVAPAP